MYKDDWSHDEDPLAKHEVRPVEDCPPVALEVDVLVEVRILVFNNKLLKLVSVL